MQDLVDIILTKPQARLIIQRVEDRLRAEEEKRQQFYAIIDEDTKAEFINGEIFYHSPVKKEHNDAAGLLHNLLKTYVMIHKLGYVGYDKILVTLTRNDYEPDICFFGREKARHFKKGQMHFPPPDLAVEVLSSNERHDRETKFQDYQEHGVLEYWIVDPSAETIEQYILKQGAYHLEVKVKHPEGHVKSVAVPGLSVPVAAAFDEAANLEALRALL